LTANRATVAIYLAIMLAAALRIAAPLAGDFTLPLLVLSGLAWTAAFVGFIAAYGPILAAPR
jgi:uncharacterized protein involved in response to NO